MSRQLNVSCASIVALLSGDGVLHQRSRRRLIAGARPPAETSSQEIVVTGSLIGRRDYKAVSPIVTLNSAAIEKSGAVTLESALNLLPQMGVGTGSSTIQNRTGRSSVNLRGLGENRALVLLNGRRVQPGEPGGAVDLTVIPAVLVKSVETITGGASAAYGSDAMAGVVNILLRNDSRD
ncbi:MAG: TonB-dependent receptor plug domain-containing protein [Alphaproteobacteria bacterium]